MYYLIKNSQSVHLQCSFLKWRHSSAKSQRHFKFSYHITTTSWLTVIKLKLLGLNDNVSHIDIKDTFNFKTTTDERNIGCKSKYCQAKTFVDNHLIFLSQKYFRCKTSATYPNDKEFDSFLAHLSRRLIFVSRTTGPISTKLGTKHPWVEGMQVCSNEGPVAYTHLTLPTIGSV